MDVGGESPSKRNGHKWIGMKPAGHHAHLLELALMASI